MKILWRSNVFGWIMTGIIGKNAKWFFGFSKSPEQIQLNNIHVNESIPNNVIQFNSRISRKKI